MPSNIKSRTAGTVTILEPAGRLVVGETAQGLDQSLQHFISAGHTAVLLDCSKVDYMDSQGISALVRNVVSMRNRGGALKLLNVSGRVFEVLNVTRLLSVIESYDDEETALRSFNP